MTEQNSKNPSQNRIEKLEQLLYTNPTDCFVMHALGLEYLKLKNESLALHFFERVLQTDPSYLGTYYHLAQLYERLQRVHEAKETYERGIKLATLQKDMHARNELLMALDELE